MAWDLSQMLETNVEGGPMSDGKLGSRFVGPAMALTDVEQRAIHNSIVIKPEVTMTQAEYLKRFEEICAEILKLTYQKNHDYAGEHDAFKNFRGCEIFTNGRITVEDGIMVRLTDKFQRVFNLFTTNALVKDEAVTDTIMDMAVYSLILKIYLEQKRGRAQGQSR